MRAAGVASGVKWKQGVLSRMRGSIRLRRLILLLLAACAVVTGCAEQQIGDHLPNVSTYSSLGATAVEPRVIAAHLDAYKGRNVAVLGQAIMVQQSDKTLIQLLGTPRGLAPTLQDTVLVVFSPGELGIEQGNCYMIYGVVYGTERVAQASTGEDVTVTAMRGYDWASEGKAAEGLCVPAGLDESSP